MRLWAEVDKLHRAGIAHRSLRAANVMVNRAGLPTIADFSFSELTMAAGATVTAVFWTSTER